MPTNYHSPVTFLSPVTMPQAAVSDGGVTLQQVQDMVSAVATSSSGTSGGTPGISSITELRNTTPTVTENSTGMALTVSASSLTFPTGMTASVTGLIKVEGF